MNNVTHTPFTPSSSNQPSRSTRNSTRSSSRAGGDELALIFFHQFKKPAAGNADIKDQGVWSGNLKAQKLYQAHGFEKAGEYEYPVGAWRDHEFILRRG